MDLNTNNKKEVKNQEKVSSETSKLEEDTNRRLELLKKWYDESKKKLESLSNDLSSMKADVLSIKEEAPSYKDLQKDVIFVKAHSEYLVEKVEKHTAEYLKIQSETELVETKIENSFIKINKFKEKIDLESS